jgi:hypothetical protein
MRERLRRGGLSAVQERSWQVALGQLAAGYTAAIERGSARSKLLVPHSRVAGSG